MKRDVTVTAWLWIELSQRLMLTVRAFVNPKRPTLARTRNRADDELVGRLYCTNYHSQHLLLLRELNKRRFEIIILYIAHQFKHISEILKYLKFQ